MKEKIVKPEYDFKKMKVKRRQLDINSTASGF